MNRVDVVCVRHPDAENVFTIFVNGVRVHDGSPALANRHEYPQAVTKGMVVVYVHDLDLGASFDASRVSRADLPILQEKCDYWRDSEFTTTLPARVRAFCSEVYQELIDEVLSTEART